MRLGNDYDYNSGAQVSHIYIYGAFQAKLTRLKPSAFFLSLKYDMSGYETNDLHQFWDFLKNFSGSSGQSRRCNEGRYRFL